MNLLAKVLFFNIFKRESVRIRANVAASPLARVFRVCVGQTASTSIPLKHMLLSHWISKSYSLGSSVCLLSLKLLIEER